MRAIQTGRPDHLVIVDRPTPQPGPGEVLITVHAAPVNPVDAQTLAGMYHELGWIDQPDGTGLGWDAAGVIAAVGPGVVDVAPGDRVAAFSHGVDKPLGALAEELVVPAEAAAPIPDELGFDDASTLPLNGRTAWQALDLLPSTRGRLLITGAAGGVGSLACVLAAERGWEVIGHARAGDRAYVEGLGVRAVDSLPEGVDAAIDAAVLVEDALAAVRDGGAYVGVIPPAVPAPRRGITPVAVNVAPDPTQLTALVERVRRGALAPRVAATYRLDDVAEAFAHAGRGGVRGRVVVHPQE